MHRPPSTLPAWVGFLLGMDRISGCQIPDILYWAKYLLRYSVSAEYPSKMSDENIRYIISFHTRLYYLENLFMTFVMIIQEISLAYK